ncbi:MAG TPA: hypothetical protein V6C97_32610 [Oculatellaceae cyanobacterium]
MQILHKLRNSRVGRVLTLSQFPAHLIGTDASLDTAASSDIVPSTASESPVASRQSESACRHSNTSIIPGRYRSRVPVRTITQVQSDLEKTRAQLVDLESEYSGKKNLLFAIERETELLLAQQFQPQISRLQAKIKELESELADHRFNAQYQMVDIGFLRLLKDQNGTKLPRFAFFDTQSDRFALGLDCWKHNDKPYVARSVPKQVSELFDGAGLLAFGLEFMAQEQDKENEAAKRREASREDRGWLTGPGRVRKTHVTIECQFAGQLPAIARQTIAKNADCFDEYFIVLEAPQWLLSCRNCGMPVYTDAETFVLLGKKGAKYWLVAETAVE